MKSNSTLNIRKWNIYTTWRDCWSIKQIGHYLGRLNSQGHFTPLQTRLNKPDPQGDPPRIPKDWKLRKTALTRLYSLVMACTRPSLSVKQPKVGVVYESNFLKNSEENVILCLFCTGFTTASVFTRWGHPAAHWIGLPQTAVPFWTPSSSAGSGQDVWYGRRKEPLTQNGKGLTCRRL